MIPMILFVLWVLGWGALISAVVIVFLRRYRVRPLEYRPWEADMQYPLRKPGDATEEADGPMYMWLR